MSVEGIPMKSTEATTSDVEEFVRELNAAMVAAEGRIRGANLKISEVSVQIKVEVGRKIGGEIQIFKVVKIGAAVKKEDLSTVTVTFVPDPAKAIEDFAIDDSLLAALETIEAVVSGMDQQLKMSSATVEIGVGRTPEGKLQIFVGGELSRTDTHVATLKFGPRKATGQAQQPA
jgi:hypothetical protein